MANDTKSKLIALGLTGAIVLVPAFEGFKLKPYRDPIGIVTDCAGHTGKDVTLEHINTPTECYDKLYRDLSAAYAVVDSCVHVPLNPNQRSAFTSFAFNVGHGAKGVKDGFCVLKNGRSPQFLTKLNAGDYYGACIGLNSWVNAGGQKFNGLVRRRSAESELCLKEYIE